MTTLHDEWLDSINAKYAGFPEGLIVFLEDKVNITQSQNAALLEALEWCASTLNGLHLGSVIDSRKRDEIRKHEAIATEAIRKASA